MILIDPSNSLCFLRLKWPVALKKQLVQYQILEESYQDDNYMKTYWIEDKMCQAYSFASKLYSLNPFNHFEGHSRIPLCGNSNPSHQKVPELDLDHHLSF